VRRNNYKESYAFVDMKGKRGQVALFVIIALVIVGIILVLLLYPRGPGPTPQQTVSPASYLKQCLGPEVKPVLERLARQGGYDQPEGALEIDGEKVKYLCYTAEYYKTCVVQEPMIKEHIERELQTILGPKLSGCSKGLKSEYEKRGYSVALSDVASQVSIEPGQIVIAFKGPMTITKDSTQTFEGFSISIESEMYDLLMLASSIIDFETTYGDSETTVYLAYYPDLKMKKLKLSDGSKLYTLQNVMTNESFRFASRSLSWPPGGSV
jgi:hypothetical protein